MEIPFNGFYVHDSLPISNQECTNWVPIEQDTIVGSSRQLIGSEGIKRIAEASTAALGNINYANRGSHVFDGMPYFVNGQYLYVLFRISDYLAYEDGYMLYNLGYIQGNARVSMADNGTQLMILVPGGKGYIYQSGGLVEITDPDFTANGTPQHVVFIDGYFACSTDSKKWIVSSLNDGTSWDALDVGTAESNPDSIVAPIVLNNQIFLTGSITTEGFRNIGGAGFPFQRSNVFLDKGCSAPFTLLATNQRFFMIGKGKNEQEAVWMYHGGSFQKISTIAIDTILQSYTDDELLEAFAITWSTQGQYYISFTVSDRTFVYSITSGLWHERKSTIYNTINVPEQKRWRVNSLVTAYGENIVADAYTGYVGVLDKDTYTDYNNYLVRTISTMPIVNEGRSYRCPKIELTMESGVGNNEVTNPMVSLAISRDGKTFDFERNRPIGTMGKFNARAIWYKNGRFPHMGVFRFRLSDPVKPVIIKLEADFV